MTGSFLFGVSLTASFLAGVLALFAPCCITFLFPSYLGTIFRDGKRVMWYTLVFAAGLSLILVPIALGFRLFVFLLDAYHTQVYYAGALVLILMGIATIRPFFHLPALFKAPGDWKKNVNTGSVFTLGVMSGLTSSCCAPVLFAAVTLTALSPSLLQAAIVSLAYVLGIVFPLFVLSLFYQRLTSAFAGKMRTRLYLWSTYAGSAIFILSGIAIAIANARGLIVMNQMEGYSMNIRLFVFSVAKSLQNPVLDTGLFVGIIVLFVWLLKRSAKGDGTGPSPKVPAQKAAAQKAAIPLSGRQLIMLLMVSLAVNLILAIQLVAPKISPNIRVPWKKTEADIRASLFEQINPPKGYAMKVSLGDLGPRMIRSGAIDLDKFREVYKQNGQPLTETQLRALTQGTTDSLTITRENAYFLLNFFWAVGLANRTAILTDGPMVRGGTDQAGSFASTGGWTLAQGDPMAYYAKDTLIPLTQDQEALVKKVADNIYRPCCDNPTSFPDCNHGMALLGLLELMAANGSTEKDMYDTAKYVNAYWFPTNYYDVANYFYRKDGISFANVPAKTVLSRDFSSATGWSRVKKWLSDNGYTEQAPASGGSCGA